MKIVMVIYRRSLDQEIRRFLESIDAKAFTEAPKVAGIGDAKEACQSFSWPGHHCMILSALTDVQAERVIAQLKEFRDEQVRLRGGANVPLRIFTVPCEETT
jgi:hypothetical protein